MRTKDSDQQLQAEDRMTIASMKQTGASVRAMARTLGRSPGTISRELTRNSCAQTGYSCRVAQERRSASRLAAMLRAPWLSLMCAARAGSSC